MAAAGQNEKYWERRMFVVTPPITAQRRHPKLLLWKSAFACGAAIKVQKIRANEQTRVVVRGQMQACGSFAADLGHLRSRDGWIVQEVPVDDISELRALFDEAFITFNADDGCIERTPDDVDSREGSSGGAAAPRRPEVNEVERMSTASGSTVRSALGHAQASVDAAHQETEMALLEAKRERASAAAALAREGLATKALETAEAKAEAARRALEEVEAKAEAERAAAALLLAALMKRLTAAGIAAV